MDIGFNSRIQTPITCLMTNCFGHTIKFLAWSSIHNYLKNNTLLLKHKYMIEAKTKKMKAKVEMQPHCATKCKKPILIRSLKI